MFAALGRFDYRFRRVLPVLALAVVIGLNVWASLGGGKLIQGGWQVPNSQAEQADALLASRFGKTATSMLVIYRSTDGAASSPGFEQKVIDSLSAVKADPSVQSVITYGATRDPKLLSSDGTATLAVVQLNKGPDAAVEDSARLAADVKTTRRRDGDDHRRAAGLSRVQHQDREGPGHRRDDQLPGGASDPAGRLRNGGRCRLCRS